MKTIEEILAKAKINEDGSLDESIVQELQGVVNEIVDAKVDIKAAEKVQEALEPTIEQTKKELHEMYAQKFEDYKADTAGKFSKFCDDVFDKELVIPEEIQEWAHKGQRYADLIEEIRTRVAIDEGKMNDTISETLQEARTEISSLRDQLNAQIAENIKMKDEYNEVLREAKEEIQKLGAQVYISEKCEGLSAISRTKVQNLLKGETDAEKIDERFDFIVKNVLNEDPGTPLGQEQTPYQENVEQKCKCPSCGKVITITDGNGTSCEMIKCPDCADVNLVCADCEPAPANENKEPAKPAQPANEPADNLDEKFIASAAQVYAQYIN